MSVPVVTDDFLRKIVNPPKCVGGVCGTRVPPQLVQMMAKELLERRSAQTTQLDRIEQGIEQVMRMRPYSGDYETEEGFSP